MTVGKPPPAPPKGYRPAIPMKAKVEAALRLAGFRPEDRIEWDHDPPLQLRVWVPERGDTDPPANDPRYLVPRLKERHREKTATQDAPRIAKTKRLAKDQEEFRRRMLAKAGSDDGQSEPAPPKARGGRKWPKRPFPKASRR